MTYEVKIPEKLFELAFGPAELGKQINPSDLNKVALAITVVEVKETTLMVDFLATDGETYKVELPKSYFRQAEDKPVN